MEGYHGVFCQVSFVKYHKFKFLVRWIIEVEIFDFYVILRKISMTRVCEMYKL